MIGALRRLVDVAAEGARVLDAPMVMYGPGGEPFEPDWSGTLSRREPVEVLVQVGVWHRDCKARRMLPPLRALLRVMSKVDSLWG